MEGAWAARSGKETGDLTSDPLLHEVKVFDSFEVLQTLSWVVEFRVEHHGELSVFCNLAYDAVPNAQRMTRLVVEHRGAHGNDAVSFCRLDGPVNDGAVRKPANLALRFLFNPINELAYFLAARQVNVNVVKGLI